MISAVYTISGILALYHQHSVLGFEDGIMSMKWKYIEIFKQRWYFDYPIHIQEE